MFILSNGTPLSVSKLYATQCTLQRKTNATAAAEWRTRQKQALIISQGCFESFVHIRVKGNSLNLSWAILLHGFVADVAIKVVYSSHPLSYPIDGPIVRDSTSALSDSAN